MSCIFQMIRAKNIFSILNITAWVLIGLNRFFRQDWNWKSKMTTKDMQTYVMRCRDHCLWCGSTVRNWIHIGTTLGQQSVCYGSITVMHFRYDYTGIWVCKFQRCVEWAGMVLQWAVFYHNNKWFVMLHRVGWGNMLWRFVQTCGWHLTVIYWQLTLLKKSKKNL